MAENSRIRKLLGSFGLDLRGLEDFAPLGYLAPDEGGEFFRRARGDVHGVEALAYVRSAERLAAVAGEPVHDCGGRVGGGEDAEPERRFVPGEPRFLHGR